MSTLNSLFNTVLTSKSFANFSSIYFKYLKVTGCIGFTFGIGVSIAHLLDTSRENRREKKRIMNSKNIVDEDLLTNEELEKCENSNLYNFIIATVGPLFGASVGIMWPIIVTLGPIYYVFGEYLGSIVNTLLIISASMVEEDKKSLKDN